MNHATIHHSGRVTYGARGRADEPTPEAATVPIGALRKLRDIIASGDMQTALSAIDIVLENGGNDTPAPVPGQDELPLAAPTSPEQARARLYRDAQNATDASLARDGFNESFRRWFLSKKDPNERAAMLESGRNGLTRARLGR